MVIERRLPAWVGAVDVVVVSGAEAGDPVQAEAIEGGRRRGADVLCDLPREGPAAQVGESGVSWIEPLAFVAPERALLRLSHVQVERVAVGIGAGEQELLFELVDPGKEWSICVLNGLTQQAA